MSPLSPNSSDASQPPSFKLRDPASPKHWEEQRGNFQRLYSTKSLALVMAEMESLYSFEATKRQYKRKITEWNLDKNIKDDEMRAMLRIQRKRKSEGKDSDFIVRGRLVDRKKIARFLHRKGNEEDIHDQGARTGPPSDVHCYTPSGTRTESPVREKLSTEAASTPSDTIDFANDRSAPTREPTTKGIAELDIGRGSSSTPTRNKTPPEKPTATWRFPSHDMLLYGFDLGKPDPEISGENANSMILDFTPPERVSALDYNEFLNTKLQNGPGNDASPLQHGRYYGQGKRQIQISKSLLPLPDILLSNPANLLYFHHFVNNTARLLMAHDCAVNPFRTVIPRIAITEHSLMNTLLAHSAFNRAALLGHRESLRVATYIGTANRLLRHALRDPKVRSLAIITVPLLMASMNIRCYTAPEQAIIHLTAARNFLEINRPSLSQTDPATLEFIQRWLMQLELIKNASGTVDGSPQEHLNVRHPESFNTWIDDLWGVAHCCMTKLALVARLTREASSKIIPDCMPTADLKVRARMVKQDLDIGANQLQYIYCCEREKDIIVATNQAYHWAGMIQLDRKVLRTPSSHQDIQSLVRKIVDILGTVRENSTSKIALLFPLFIADSEALRPIDRELVLNRFFELGLLGFSYVRKARESVQDSWKTGILIQA